MLGHRTQPCMFRDSVYCTYLAIFTMQIYFNYKTRCHKWSFFWKKIHSVDKLKVITNAVHFYIVLLLWYELKFCRTIYFFFHIQYFCYSCSFYIDIRYFAIFTIYWMRLKIEIIIFRILRYHGVFWKRHVYWKNSRLRSKLSVY